MVLEGIFAIVNTGRPLAIRCLEGKRDAKTLD
jgi:hypothetical protein